MSTPIAIEVNCATGAVIERPLTAEEIAANEKAAAEFAAKKHEEDAQAAADAEAKAALLTRSNNEHTNCN
jgi:hypothetical protein